MRPVPSRTLSRARFGDAPPLPAALTWLRRGETGARYPTDALMEDAADAPFVDPSIIAEARSYADFVWLAVRLVKDAGTEARKKATPSEATAIDAAVNSTVDRIARNFSPGTERVKRLTQLDGRALYPVSFNALQGLFTSDGAGAFFNTSYGSKAPTSKALLQPLIDRLTALGNEAGFYAGGKQAAGPLIAYQGRPIGTGEDLTAVGDRWVAEAQQRMSARPAPQTVSQPATASTPALTMSLPTSNYPGGAVTAQAGPGGVSVSMQDGGGVTSEQPAWLMPALIGTAVAGVALLLLPDGSGNRGSRARNFDYGRVASDAQEGRMLRSTLRNLETDARAMRQMLKDDDDLPQWVHAKVQTSADRVNSAHRYLRAKAQRD